MVLSWNQDSSTLVASGDVRHVKLWDVKSERKIQDIPTGKILHISLVSVMLVRSFVRLRGALTVCVRYQTYTYKNAMRGEKLSAITCIRNPFHPRFLFDTNNFHKNTTRES